MASHPTVQPNLIRVEKPLPNRPNRVLWVYNAFQSAHKWNIFYTSDFTRAKIYRTLAASQIIIDGGGIEVGHEDITIVQVDPRDGITPVVGGGGGGILKVITLSMQYPVGKFQIGNSVASYIPGPTVLIQGTGTIVAPLYPERHRIRIVVLSGSFKVNDYIADVTSNTLGGTILGIV